MDQENEENEEDVVFSSRLKSVLLNAPKELSHAMFDFASSAFALTTTNTRTRRIIESHDEEEEENEEEERGGKGVVLKSSLLRERLQPFIMSSNEDADERTTNVWFLEQLNERVVKRVLVEMTTSMVSKKENNLEEEDLEAVVEKVVESSFAFTTKREEEKDEEDEKKARVRLKKILRSRAKEWFEKTMTLMNSSPPREEGRRRLGLRVGTPRLVEYDWTAYATRASSSLESLTLNASSASSVSSASCLRLSLRVSKEEEEEEEEHQHHRLDLDLDSLAVLVDALRDAKVAVVAASGGNM